MRGTSDVRRMLAKRTKHKRRTKDPPKLQFPDSEQAELIPEDILEESEQELTVVQHVI